MRQIQPITHNGRIVALVAGQRAVISEHVPERHRPTVKAMCLYAIEIAAGHLPGLYTDTEALAYARSVAAQRN
jgi:hypothetical protein